MLNSYHKGFPWSDEELRGIEETLAGSGRPIDILVEYLDAEHYPDAGHWRNLEATYRHKYAGRQLEAIITADDNAFDFLLQHHDDIFTNVPVVFCGTNDFKPEVLKGRTGITGVPRFIDYEDTIHLIQRLHRDTQRIVIILPDTVTGAHDRDLIESFAGKIADQVEIDLWFGLPVEESLARVEALKAGTVVITAGMAITQAGRVVSSAVMAERVSSAAHVPVYGVLTSVLGHGVIGGRMIDGFTHGTVAARLALEILGGRPVSEIPVVTTSRNPYMFDYPVLTRFGISMEDLPEGAIVINQPEADAELFQTYLWIAAAVILVLGLFIATLILLVAKSRKAEEALRENQRLFDAYLRHSTAAIFLKGPEGRYLFANEAMAKRFGISVEEMIGKRFEELHSTPLVDQVKAYDAEVVETLTAQERELEMVHHDGSVHHHYDIKFPVFDRHGDLKGIGGVSTDVTEIKAAGEAARELQAELAYVARLSTMGEMAAGFAHELNQPLAAIGNFAAGCIRRLQMPSPDSGAIVSALQQITDQTKRAGDIISRIRGFVGKKDGTQADLPLSAIDINTAIESAVGLLAGDILKNGASLCLNLSPDLPCARADAIQIQQLVINLARNSMEAMSEAECRTRDLTIRTLSETPETVEIQVVDTGPGIPDDVMPRLFHPFFTTKDSGMGMGLSICQSIVDQHGGTIRATNRDKGGALFRVVLTAAERESVAA